MEYAVSCRGVTKSYKRGKDTVAVLDNFNLDIVRGEFASFMGPSGSGKTTLLNLMGGLDKPTHGELTVSGARLDQLSNSQLAEWRGRHVGFIFQFYNLMPTLTAARNVEIPLLLLHDSPDVRMRKVAAALKLVGLHQRAKHKPTELSGGQQQRVAIARAIVADPRLLICDEPTGDLDRQTAEEILELLQVLNKQYGKTIIMVTHDPRAASYASRHFSVDKGRLTQASARSAA